MPHCAADPVLEHVFVQKWVVGSPSEEHSVAPMLPEQSEIVAQYLPTPRSFPVSPGIPHVDGGASAIGASGGVLLAESSLHATARAAARAAATAA